VPTILPGIATQSSDLAASRLLSSALGQRQLGVQLATRNAALVRNKIESLLGSLAQVRQRRDQKKAAAKKKRAGAGGGIGAGIGAAAAVVAAPFTGGASLALLPALTAAGQAVGTAAAGGGGGAGDAVSGGVAALDLGLNRFNGGVQNNLQNAHETGGKTGKTGGKKVSKASPNEQLVTGPQGLHRKGRSASDRLGPVGSIGKQ